MEAVRSTAKALVSIDDMPTRHFPSDVLISFCPYPREAYDMAPHTRYLSGFQYSFLRKPFLAPQSKRQRRGIAIAMGGADPLSLTAVLLPKVRERFPEEAIEVIAGNAVKLPSKMDMMPRVIVHRQVSAQEIADIFDRCRFGIFPASTICMEALSRGLPIAAGYFVDNQMEVYRSGVVSGLFHPLGDLRELIAFPPLEFSASPTLPDFAETRNEIRALFLELAL